MGKNLMFFDVDGTLFRDDIKVPQSSIDAITKSVENGNCAILCTGRGASTIPPEVRALPFYGEICGCGTQVKLGNKTIVGASVNGDICSHLISILKEYDCRYFIENPDYFYYDPDFLPNSLFESIPLMERRYPGAIRPMSQFNNEIFKMTGYLSDEAVLPELTKLLSPWFDVIYHNEYEYIEIILKGYSKGTAVAEVMNVLGIPRENTYGFGDSGNDIPMLEAVGTGIVMGDAPSKLKERFIPTDSLYSDGLAKAMEKLTLI